MGACNMAPRGKLWLEVVRASGAREVRTYVFFQITLGSIKLCTVHEKKDEIS